MTQRFRMLLISAILGLLIGVLLEYSRLAVLSLSALIWLYLSWLIFAIQERRLWSRIEVCRTINRRPVAGTTLWTERPFTVDVELKLRSGAFHSLFAVRDLTADLIAIESGETVFVCAESARSLKLSYQAKCLSAGRLRWSGVHCRFREAQGFFLSERVVGREYEVRVLPSFVQVDDPRSSIKRVNSIPQHGIHQLQRAGVGSELLELREYQPGDPPKSIAWKVSARRDKLMTRQYESEVPVRQTLLVDGSLHMRLGGFGMRLLDQSISMAATLAKLAISVGDPVGIVLVDPQACRRLPPGTGDRAFYNILDVLADFSILPPPQPETLNQRQWALIYAMAAQRFPQLLVDDINLRPITWWPWSPLARAQLRQRRQLSNLWGELYGFSAAEIAQLTFDDSALRTIAWRWLGDVTVPWVPPLVDAGLGGPTSDSGQRLARELTRSVAHARDNELFVLISDFLHAPANLEVILPAVKVALARHHRVVVVCPSPTGLRPELSDMPSPPASLDDLMHQADQVRVVQAARAVTRRLRGLGAKVAFMGQDEVSDIVLAEAELAGRGRTISRSRQR